MILRIPNTKLRTNKALTYIEIIAGITIIAFVLVGMNGIFGVGMRNNKKAENINIALGFAQELVEQAKAGDFDAIVNIPETVSNEFRKRLDVTPNYQDDANRKLVTVTVSGPDITDVVLNCIIANPTV